MENNWLQLHSGWFVIHFNLFVYLLQVKVLTWIASNACSQFLKYITTVFPHSLNMQCIIQAQSISYFQIIFLNLNHLKMTFVFKLHSYHKCKYQGPQRKRLPQPPATTKSNCVHDLGERSPSSVFPLAAEQGHSTVSPVHLFAFARALLFKY